jgi:ferritin-like metal-binding protein YciE
MAAQDDKLRAAFEKHHGETETHVSRLVQVFDAIDAKPQGKTCDAIMGIIEEGQEILADYKGSPALDAGLLAAAQAVEHYEISRYGTLRRGRRSSACRMPRSFWKPRCNRKRRPMRR